MSTATSTTDQFDTSVSYPTQVPLLFGIFTAVAVFGWTVSTFLSGIHFWAIPQIPADATVSGSLEVVTSPWAYVGPVPLATLGALYYLTTVVLAVWWLDTRHPLIIKVLTPITATGVIASAYFVYLQLVPIGAICPFCMMSAAASMVLFGLELAILRSSKLPSLGYLLGDLRTLASRTRLVWPVIVAAMGAMTVAAFYGATLAPVPGT